MNTQSGNAHLHNMWGEIALITAVTINSFGVVLMLYSAAGISAISSVPYAFSLVLPRLTLGTWTYIFQGVLILTLMIMRKKFVPQYLCSFIVGFVFGKMLDIHEMWIGALPTALPWRILYFVISYILICIGIALSNRCGLPIIPTDLFPRELSEIISVKYSKVKISFDVICLATTAAMTGFILGHIYGLGIGTVHHGQGNRHSWKRHGQTCYNSSIHNSAHKAPRQPQSPVRRTLRTNSTQKRTA